MHEHSATTIYVVDDNVDICHSLTALLTSAGYQTRCFHDPVEFVNASASLPAGVMLLDLRMPAMSGIEVLGRLGPQLSRLPAIMITAHGDVEMAVKAIKAGAKDFIQKPFRDDVLLEIVEREVADLETVVSGQPASNLSSLTAREREVALALARGLSNKQVAAEIGISVRTVEMHRARAMQRLQCKSFAEFLILVLQTDSRERPAS